MTTKKPTIKKKAPVAKKVTTEKPKRKASARDLEEQDEPKAFSMAPVVMSN